MVRKLFGLHRGEISLNESSFLLDITKKKKTFEHTNSLDNILYITVTLTPLYSDNLQSSISTKTPLLKIVPSAIQIAKKEYFTLANKVKGPSLLV